MSIRLATTEEIIEAAKRGEPYILVDADDRENEGDVIIPAQFATPESINFMAMHARGLICLTITKERAAELKLPPMVSENRSGHGTAFTVSIEARDGVTTGISAYDRALTIATAVDPRKGHEDLVSPGHVFPLVARDGGVLVRAGHTEAAVDISRLAGLHPSAVICEVMNDDGTMARLPDLMGFAERHGLKVGTIADLIEYRRRSEVLVEKVYEGPFESCFAPDFRVHVYRSAVDSCEHLALVRGDINAEDETLVRVHRLDMAVDNFGLRTSRSGPIERALSLIGDHIGPAVAIFVQDPTPMVLSKRLQQDVGQPQTHLALRDYGIGAQMLRDLGVRDVRLLSSSKFKLAALEGFGLKVNGHVPLPEIENRPTHVAHLSLVHGR